MTDGSQQRFKFVSDFTIVFHQSLFHWEDIFVRNTASLSVPLNLDVSTEVQEGLTSLYDESGDVIGGDGQEQTTLESSPSTDVTPEYQPPIDPRSIMLKVVAPAIAGTAAVVGGSYAGLNALKTRRSNIIATFASEMVYHSSSPEEMRLCLKESSKKIITNKQELYTSYLELFVKKKVVTIASIQALSYALSLFNLSERKAGELLVNVAKGMRKQPASRGKLLFFGGCILKSEEGKSSLQPIRDMLASNYRSGGSSIVSVAQKTMASTAYKTHCVSCGPSETLTSGWDVLGLSEEDAQEIYNEVVSNDFVSDAENYYKYQSVVPDYDEDGNLVQEGFKDPEDPYKGMTESQKAARGLLDQQGKPKEPEKEPDSGVKIFECGNCGYTLFPAKGREEKFFPDGFKCPECSAEKSEFVERNAAA
ncbi:hypothetical protein TrST_g14229 [Triparma strigata]|uniref:Rubredoxin-like domain-containing protein n=1 Tax=Triparma strigata TaxID=1606541 RepID=A0A9W7EHZ1_9STRA|nr:hypothetical protein TrST_g14229 [Triparma strigata]